MKNITEWSNKEWGTALIIAGLFLLMGTVIGTPMSMVEISGAGINAAVKDIPPRSAVSLFSGIVLIIIGAVMRKK